MASPHCYCGANHAPWTFQCPPVEQLWDNFDGVSIKPVRLTVRNVELEAAAMMADAAQAVQRYKAQETAHTRAELRKVVHAQGLPPY